MHSNVKPPWCLMGRHLTAGRPFPIKASKQPITVPLNSSLGKLLPTSESFLPAVFSKWMNQLFLKIIQLRFSSSHVKEHITFIAVEAITRSPSIRTDSTQALLPITQKFWLLPLNPHLGQGHHINSHVFPSSHNSLICLQKMPFNHHLNEIMHELPLHCVVIN